MSLRSFLAPVIPNFPAMPPDQEIETLRMLPAETVFFALKEADSESALWVMENLKADQLQGVIDLDCWRGDSFLPEKFFRYFEFMSYTTPEKLHEFMRDLDPEVIVLALMDVFEVDYFDPQNPPEYPESKLMISPDNRYALKLKTADPNLRERLFHWMNKSSAMDIELLRRHLESLRWETKGDAEEFAYQIKRGRIEELGFMEREEAVNFFAPKPAPQLKHELLNEPLHKEVKQDTPLMDTLGSVEFLPLPISRAVQHEGFFRQCLEKLENNHLRELLRMEFVRTLNGVFMADEIIGDALDILRDSAVRTRQYLDLGLFYLSDGSKERGITNLETQPVFQIARLGWNLIQDLVRAAKEISEKFNANTFEQVDRDLLKSLSGRHPHIGQPQIYSELAISPDGFMTLPGIAKIAEHLGAMAILGHFFTDTIGLSLHMAQKPFEADESAFARIATGLFRQASGGEFTPRGLTVGEFDELRGRFNSEQFIKFAKVIEDKVPVSGRSLFAKRMATAAQELAGYIKNQNIDRQFATALRWNTDI